MNINVNTNVTVENQSTAKSSSKDINKNSSQTQTTQNNVTINNNTAVVYEKSEDSGSYKQDMDAIEKMKAEVDLKTKSLRDLVEKLFTKQGKTFDTSISLISKKDWENVIANGVDQATIDKAKADIGEDGYYGVKQTTDRIMSFAKALSGGDPSKFELLKNAVIKGFEKAESAWGDKLPQISQDTYKSCMAEFDKWEAEIKPNEEKVTA